MLFEMKNHIKTQIEIDNEILEQVSKFSCSSCDISFKKDQAVEQKLNNFRYTCVQLK